MFLKETNTGDVKVSKVLFQWVRRGFQKVTYQQTVYVIVTKESQSRLGNL